MYTFDNSGKSFKCNCKNCSNNKNNNAIAMKLF